MKKQLLFSFFCLLIFSAKANPRSYKTADVCDSKSSSAFNDKDTPKSYMKNSDGLWECRDKDGKLMHTYNPEESSKISNAFAEGLKTVRNVAKQKKQILKNIKMMCLLSK